MDKKNTTIGVALLVAALASLFFSNRYGNKSAASLPATPPPGHTVTVPAPAGTTAATASAAPAATLPASPAQPALGLAEKVSLSNDFIVVTFTNHGGAIDNVALKKHLAVQGQPALYTLNSIQAAPALSLRDFPGADRNVAYARQQDRYRGRLPRDQ